MSFPRRTSPRARRAGPPDTRPAEFDMTPMIDVTFQLIVFFLVANDLSRKEIVDLALPRALHSAEDVCDGSSRVIVNVLKPRNAASTAPVVTIRGREFGPSELARELQVHADRRRPHGPGTPSDLTALLRADRDAPWSHVQQVMQACATPRVSIHRLQFAATLDDAPRAAGGAR